VRILTIASVPLVTSVRKSQDNFFESALNFNAFRSEFYLLNVREFSLAFPRCTLPQVRI
jgi:hypothetical protein